MSLQIINGLGSSELRDYLPKWGEDSSESSSESDERTTGERGGIIEDLKLSCPSLKVVSV